jgi:hypothetical protein
VAGGPLHAGLSALSPRVSPPHMHMKMMEHVQQRAAAARRLNSRTVIDRRQKGTAKVPMLGLVDGHARPPVILVVLIVNLLSMNR